MHQSIETPTPRSRGRVGDYGRIETLLNNNLPLGVAHLTDFDFGSRPHVVQVELEASTGIRVSKDGGKREKTWFSRATQAQAQASKQASKQERSFNRENEVDTSISTSTSTSIRIKTFPQHKRKENCYVWPIKALDLSLSVSEHLNKMADAVVVI